MQGLIRDICLIVCVIVGAFILFATLTMNQWRTNTANELSAEIAGLTATDRLLPLVGVLDPLLRSTDDTQGFYLVIDKDGQKISGNISLVDRSAENTRGDFARWRVLVEGRELTVYGEWTTIDGVVDVLIARSAQSVESYIRLVGLATLLITGIISAVLLFRTYRRERTSQQMEQKFITTFEALGRGDAVPPLDISRPGSHYFRLARTLDLVRERINDRIGMFAYLKRFLRHDVMLSITRAADVIERSDKLTDAALDDVLMHIESSQNKYDGIMAVADYVLGDRVPFESIGLKALITRVVKDLEFDAESKGIRFEADLEDISAFGLTGPFNLVLDNLINNALSYSDPSSTISIQLKPAPDGRPMFLIRDQGPGLAAFPENFNFRTGPTRARRGPVAHLADGNGCGLILVYKTVEFLNAHISISDRANTRGLEVKVTFMDATAVSSTSAGLLV